MPAARANARCAVHARSKCDCEVSSACRSKCECEVRSACAQQVRQVHCGFGPPLRFHRLLRRRRQPPRIHGLRVLDRRRLRLCRCALISAALAEAVGGGRGLGCIPAALQAAKGISGEPATPPVTACTQRRGVQPVPSAAPILLQQRKRHRQAYLSIPWCSGGSSSCPGLEKNSRQQQLVKFEFVLHS